jgi:hypothetical protein
LSCKKGQLSKQMQSPKTSSLPEVSIHARCYALHAVPLRNVGGHGHNGHLAAQLANLLQT